MIKKSSRSNPKDEMVIIRDRSSNYYSFWKSKLGDPPYPGDVILILTPKDGETRKELKKRIKKAIEEAKKRDLKFMRNQTKGEKP